MTRCLASIPTGPGRKLHLIHNPTQTECPLHFLRIHSPINAIAPSELQDVIGDSFPGVVVTYSESVSANGDDAIRDVFGQFLKLPRGWHAAPVQIENAHPSDLSDAPDQVVRYIFSEARRRYPRVDAERRMIVPASGLQAEVSLHGKRQRVSAVSMLLSSAPALNAGIKSVKDIPSCVENGERLYVVHRDYVIDSTVHLMIMFALLRAEMELLLGTVDTADSSWPWLDMTTGRCHGVPNLFAMQH